MTKLAFISMNSEVICEVNLWMLAHLKGVLFFS